VVVVVVAVVEIEELIVVVVVVVVVVVAVVVLEIVVVLVVLVTNLAILIPLEAVTFSSTQELPSILCSPKVHCRAHKSPRSCLHSVTAQ
jgi:hypothetical protein